MEMNRQGNVAPDGEVLHPSLVKRQKKLPKNYVHWPNRIALLFGEMSKDITWFKEWTKILDEGNAPLPAGIMMDS